MTLTGTTHETAEFGEQQLVAFVELGVHPPVDEWVVGAAAHGQPVGGDPHDAHVRGVQEQVVVHVVRDGDGVQGEPAHPVDTHHCDHHLDYLERRKRSRVIVI